MIPAGISSNNLISLTDFFPTFAELAGAKLPEGVTLDGRSFAGQISGKTASTRDSLLVMLGRKWYVRESNWKLNEAGELFDMRDAPFDEKLVPSDSKNSEAIAARERLKTVLAELNPAAGKVNHGTGSGRAKERDERKEENPQSKTATAIKPTVAGSKDRDAMFNRIDKEKVGKVARESYMSSQSDAEAAAQRFEKWDANKDGFLERAEFTNQGGKK